MAPNNRRGKKTPHTIFGMEDGSEPEPEAEGEAEADADADAQAQAEAEAQAERDENGIAEAAEGEGMYEPELEVGVEQVQETQVEMQVQDQHVQVQEQVQEQGLLRKELQDYHDPDPEALNAEEFIPADSDAVGHDRLHTLAQHVVDAVEQGHYPTVTAAEQAVQAANDEMAAEYQRQYDERGGDYAADEQDHHHVHHHRDEDDQEHDHGHEHDGHDRNAAAEDLLSFATEQALPSEEYSQQFSSLLDHATAAAFRGQDGVGSSAQSALQDAIDAETAARAALTSSFDADDVAHALGAGGTRGGEGGVVDENGQMVFPQEASEYDQAVAAAAAAVGQENGGAGAGDMTGLEGDEANARNKSSRKRKRVKEPMAEDQIKAKKETHKEVERRRRQVISDGIDQISALIPQSDKQKGAILQAAASYFKTIIEEKNALQERVATLELEKQTLEGHYADLHARYQSDQDHAQNVEAAWAKDREELEQLKTATRGAEE